jgi:aspartate racemase
MGGMSWESTLLYYRLLNQGVAARLGGLHSAGWCCTAWTSRRWRRCRRQATGRRGAGAGRCGARPARAGAEGLVLATNTMHKVAAAIEAAAGCRCCTSPTPPAPR